jgi:N-acetylmuramoyl-L-alanine amidase
VGRIFHPKNALPCVGLVVLGGCLTLIMMPDRDESRKPSPVPDSSAGPHWLPRLEVLPMPTVVVDPGHGGKDEGTKWRGVSEKDMTLDVALRVERLLKSVGFPTVMTRRENVYVSLEERARIANQLNDALFVSIHFNSDPTGASTGIETFYARQKAPPDSEWTWVGFFNHAEPVQNDTSEVLAGTVQAALDARTQTKNRGIHSCNFYVVHHTRCPAILVEGGFLSNVFEAQLLAYDQYRETLAQGIVEGVMAYQKMRVQPGGVKPVKLAELEMR